MKKKEFALNVIPTHNVCVVNSQINEVFEFEAGEYYTAQQGTGNVYSQQKKAQVKLYYDVLKLRNWPHKRLI